MKPQSPLPSSGNNGALAYARTLLATLAAIALVLGVQGLLDRLERDAEARIEFLRIVDEKCMPLRDGENTSAVRNGNTVQCRVYIRNTPGMARALVSAAVMEVPQ